MALHLHRSAARAQGSSFAFAAVCPIPGGAPRSAMAMAPKTGHTRVLRSCDPKRAESLAPRGDTKWEGDSEVEGIGTN